MFSPTLIPLLGMTLMGILQAIKGSFFERMFRWLWLGGILDFIYAFYVWIYAALITLFVLIKWSRNPYILLGVFLFFGLIFRFALVSW